MNNFSELYNKCLNLKDLTLEEAIFLYENAPISDLIFIANEIRKLKHNKNKVSWIIDRNVNITNVCVSGCKFCNFFCSKNSSKAYITSIDEYKTKIEETLKLGGNQLLLQGGMNPDLGLDYYKNLFKTLKSLYPNIKLHALGPPEIAFIAKLENCKNEVIIDELINSGLDSIPGAGAEILCDRVRSIVSPKKCSSEEWLNIMEIAHKKNILTTATMVYGHIETVTERINHLIKIRDTQAKKPKNSIGFISFIPWPIQAKNTVLEKDYNIKTNNSIDDYIRIIAISRIVLNNISNIQASWLTVGVETAQLCLHAGANDLGSIMIEENVVSSAGANYKLSKYDIQKAITDAGFTPFLRNQKFEEIC